MREREERRTGDAEDVAEQRFDDGRSEGRTRFSSSGPFPEVASDETTLKPSASELAYEDTLAPPREKDKQSKGEVKDAPKLKEPEPNKAPAEIPQLLKDFAGKFADAAKLIEASPKACKLVKDAQDAGAKFGGYAEEGPAASAWPYTSGDTVYIPKAHTDPLTAMSDFLFELNNAIRAPKFAEIHKEARKGKNGSLTNKTYARKKVDLEVDGMLHLGEVWLETKKSAGKANDETWSKHDGEFYLAEYQDVKAGKKTKDDVINSVLQRKYTEGAHAGKTVEQYYMDQYDKMNGN